MSGAAPNPSKLVCKCHGACDRPTRHEFRKVRGDWWWVCEVCGTERK